MRVIARRVAVPLALLVAAPAQAQQTGLPLWLIGTWCGELGGAEANGAAGPQLCDSWEAGDDGTLRNRIRPAEGSDVVDDGSAGTIAIEQGRLVMRGGADGKVLVDYREVSRGPREMILENLMDGRVRKLELRREGDDLIEDIWLEDRTLPQRTVYRLRK